MSHFIFWYLTVTILGLVTFPLAYQLLKHLPDRGYTIARVLGLLIWGYIFWLLGVTGILHNNTGGLLFAFGILLSVSVWATLKIGWDKLLSWLKAHLKVIITSEILFALAFAAWAFVRANNPDIMGTEKPMELAFINAILRSEIFPPHDPWLSGYSISYYYFGYVMVAMLAKLTATTGGVAFNLAVSLVFALAALGIYGLVYNLLTSNQREEQPSAFLAALLGPFFTLIVSNWEGFLHYIHSRGVFWKAGASGQMTSGFWKWLGVWDLVSPPTENEFGHWWWWRASRIIQDVDFTGYEKEVISEFPFFSYLLGDLHPHVLAMPFVFLCLALAFNLFRKQEGQGFRWLGLFQLRLSPLAFGVSALALGGMSFLNTWDFPIYVSVLAGAYALQNLLNADAEQINIKTMLGDFLSLGIALGITGIALYLPFYLGFASQAGGFIPNVIYVTRGAHLWIIFGPFFIPIFWYLFWLWKKHGNASRLRTGLSWSLGIIGALFSLMLLVLLIIAILPPLPGKGYLREIFLTSLAAPNFGDLILEGFVRRGMWMGAWFTLMLLIALVIGLLWKHKNHLLEETQKLAPSHAFVLLLTLWGALLVLGPEFIFLRDLFGYRINTIFKFYYQAWLLWSIVAAYGSVILIRKLRDIPVAIFIGVLLIVLGMALVYPVKGLWKKTNGFSPFEGRTLDGAAYFERTSPDDASAAQWLSQAPFGVIAEATGGSYTSSARMATYSGLPTVLGWDFHEIQWRGNGDQVTPRQNDLATLYCSRDWNTTQEIIQRYNIHYIVVGQLEYNTYQPGESNCTNGLREAKFDQNLVVVARFGQTVIYSTK